MTGSTPMRRTEGGGFAVVPLAKATATQTHAEARIALDAIHEKPAPPDLESAIAHLLNELSLVQDELLQVLVARCDRLAGGDQGEATALRRREASLGNRLQACHAQRRMLRAMAAEQRLPARELGSVPTSLTPGHHVALESHEKVTSAPMRLLQDGSLTSWVLAQRRVLHLAQLLEILATDGRS